MTFEKDDSVVLVVNNYGGLSNLELGALTDETITQLGKMPLRKTKLERERNTDKISLASTWNIKPVRILTGAFETSLNAPGFSISLCNLSAASRETGTSVDELLDLLDAPTTAVSWPNVTGPRKQSGEAKKAPEESAGNAKVADGVDIVGE